MMQEDVTKSFGEGKPIPIGAMTKKMKVHLHKPRVWNLKPQGKKADMQQYHSMLNESKPVVTGEEN
jgi:hypothetical protein